MALGAPIPEGAVSPAPRSSRRIGDLLWLPLAGLLAFEVVSGLYLFLKQEPDLKVYAFLKIHIRTGLVVAVLLTASTLVHLASRRYWFYAVITLIYALGSVPAIIFLVNWVPPGAAVGILAFGAGTLGWWGGGKSGWPFRSPSLERSEEGGGSEEKHGGRSQRLAGLAWAALTVTLMTGIYLGVFKGLGTISNIVHYFHFASAVLGSALLLVHVLRERSCSSTEV